MRRRKQRIKKTFERQMLEVGSVPNLIAGLIVITFVLLLTEIPRESLLSVIIFSLIITGILQCVVAPVTNKLITKSLSDDLEEMDRYETTSRERTRLLRKLMSCPQKVAIQVFLVFFSGAVFWVSSFDWFFNMPKESTYISYMAVVIGAYVATILSMSQSQKLCSRYGCKIVAKGVDKEEVKRRHSFGLSSVKMVALYILFPIVVMNAMFLFLAWRFSEFCSLENTSLIRFFIACAGSLAFLLSLAYMIYSRMMISISGMRNMLESMDDGNINEVKPAPSDLSNEFMYNIFLVNSIIELLKNILHISGDISAQVVEAGSELSVVSKETAVTSLEQSTSIKELLTSMEESDSFSRDVAVKIVEVAGVARKTVQDVIEGFELLKQNVQKLAEIRAANETTYEGIKKLGEKISGISDIAFIINSIADQTNIIAFNAEIEASSAGEAGKNFHIVANEIRRLTNSTIESTKEIRDKIAEIQHSSEELLETSRFGRGKIIEGGKIVDELKSNFEIIQNSSESTDVASEDIRTIIQQQTAAFEQIVVTLRQISAGAESFSETTQTINASAEQLCFEASKLEKIQPVLVSEDETKGN